VVALSTQVLEITTMAFTPENIAAANKNGIEALCEIKASQPTVEVIMVTSNSDPETVQESIQNGACGFIIKPFNSARVLDTLEKIGARLRQKKT